MAKYHDALKTIPVDIEQHVHYKVCFATLCLGKRKVATGQFSNVLIRALLRGELLGLQRFVFKLHPPFFFHIEMQKDDGGKHY